jgi:hypothetical protein
MPAKRDDPAALSPHDVATARRALLQLWLDRFGEALDAHRRESKDRFRDGGGPRNIPPLQLPLPSRDMLSLLLGGIEAALAGAEDPFGIATPRGNPPRLSLADRINAVAEIMDGAEVSGGTTTNIKNVAKKYGVSFETMRDAYYDVRINRYAMSLRKIFGKSAL